MLVQIKGSSGRGTRVIALLRTQRRRCRASATRHLPMDHRHRGEPLQRLRTSRGRSRSKTRGRSEHVKGIRSVWEFRLVVALALSLEVSGGSRRAI